MNEAREREIKGWKVREEWHNTPAGPVLAQVRFLAPGNMGPTQIPADVVLLAADLVNESRRAPPHGCEACGGKGWLHVESGLHGKQVQRCDGCPHGDALGSDEVARAWHDAGCACGAPAGGG